MERLTRKEKKVVLLNNRNIGKNYLTIKQYEKLQQLENIEEELGIDLITLFRALKDGIYCIDFDNQDIRKFKAPLCFNSTSKQFYWYGSNIGYPDLKDYGKTWSLDRSELEND